MAGMASASSGLVVGDELGELLFQQFILGLEARDEAEDLFQDLTQRQTAIHGGGFAQLVEGVVLLGLVENLAIDIVDDAIPLPGLDGFSDGFVLAHGVLKFLEEHAVDLHALEANGLLLDRGRGCPRRDARRCRRRLPDLVAVRLLGPLPLRRGELQHFIVVELLLEIFAVGKEIEELEGGLLRLLSRLP